MKIQKVFILIACIVLFLTGLPISTLAEEIQTGGSEVDSGGVVIDSYNTYNNYYYYLNSEYDDINLVSLNNKDNSSYWRPKYDDLELSLQEYVEMKDKNVQVKTNGFDVDWSEINKSSLPTSRALEKLGYDFLLYKETVPKTAQGTWGDSNSGEYTYSVDRSIGYNKPITAPYFIMNVYKALGINLYDVYFQYKKIDRPTSESGTYSTNPDSNSLSRVDKVTSEVGVYVTRTNPESYWKLFLNDHPINLGVYNDSNVGDITSGKLLNTSDAITILAEMLDFYGEPVLSKQEEYLLLQVYGNDVPNTLPDSQKQAWSYLKSRGIIGDNELKYSDSLSFEVMMDLLMRASDKDSRTNFKEIQITTNLDDTFIRNGYYQNEVVMINQPKVSPIESSVSYANSTRYDFLIGMDNNVAFKFQDTGELNRDIFISKGPLHDDKAIDGSVFEGIVEGSFYHFSIPISELNGESMFYVNSSKSGDWPLNYHIPISIQDNRVGGVYKIPSPEEYNNLDSIVYSLPSTFQDEFPDTVYVDSNRRNSSVDLSKVSAAGYGSIIKAKFPSTLIDVSATRRSIQLLDGNVTEDTTNKTITIEVGLDKLGGTTSTASEAISRKLVLKDEYIYKSDKVQAILGLTGNKLLVSLNEMQNMNLILGYKVIPDSETLIIYTISNDVIIVDNQNKIIQKGNTYLQIREEQPLYTYGGDKDYLVDFRALYGSKEVGFVIGEDLNGNTIVTKYDNSFQDSTLPSTDRINRVNEYTYYSTRQYLPYSSGNELLDIRNIDLLYKLDSNATIGSNIRDEITEVLIPFSSTNVMGNYLLYGEYEPNYGLENYYLILITPKGVSGSTLTSDKDYKSMVVYHPANIPADKYDIHTIKLDSSTSEEKYGIKLVPGVGWAYSIQAIENTSASKQEFMSSYRSHTDLATIPLAISYEGRIPSLLNFNMNYFTDDMMETISGPSSGRSYNAPIPAAINIQSWFTNKELIPTITGDFSAGKRESIPKLFYGTMKVSVGTNGTSFSTVNGGVNLGNYLTLFLSGMNRLENTYTDADSYLIKGPGIYSITSDDLDVTLSTTKTLVKETEIDRRTANIQEFFESFENITFMNFIHGLDNSMSILYYLITRAVPLIILSLLVLMLMLSMVSDMKMVQLFCEKVFDPVRILTLGNHSIQTIRNKFLILSLIGALILMGIIQAGNLEKIIMFFIRTYYAIRLMFD